ncbi:hypothetical protein [Sphingomonas sp. OTU376]|uniref:hypothetical protein n=1 Tax=Sphingomonas sp. OTU376 TaxID=3043863 RepID=UPI00313BB619
MIIFLRDHSVGEGNDLEQFTKAQKVERSTPESEMHFVRRGHAAFFDPETGALTDHDGNPIEMPEDLELVSDGQDARTGRVPPRAITGSGVTAKKAGDPGKPAKATPNKVKAADKAPKPPKSAKAGAKPGKPAASQQLQLDDGFDALSDDELLEKAVALGVEGDNRDALLVAIRAKLAADQA